jgi:hypothetical protein
MPNGEMSNGEGQREKIYYKLCDCAESGKVNTSATFQGTGVSFRFK